MVSCIFDHVMSLLAPPAKEWLRALALPDGQTLQIAHALASIAASTGSSLEIVVDGADTLLALPLQPVAKKALISSLAKMQVGYTMCV